MRPDEQGFWERGNQRFRLPGRLFLRLGMEQDRNTLLGGECCNLPHRFMIDRDLHLSPCLTASYIIGMVAEDELSQPPEFALVQLASEFT